MSRRKRQGYSPSDAIAQSDALREVLDAVGSGVFSPGQSDRFRDLVDDLHHRDNFLVTADFDAYAAAQRQVGQRWLDRAAWWKSSVLNTARTGWFSSDRAMREYAAEIWNVPVPASIRS